MADLMHKLSKKRGTEEEKAEKGKDLLGRIKKERKRRMKNAKRR